MAGLDLLPAEASPLAVASPGRWIVAPFAGVDAELAADDQRRLAGAAKWAAQEQRGPGLTRQLNLQRPAHRHGLRAAALGQR
jgi:hypothetical protein